MRRWCTSLVLVFFAGITNAPAVLVDWSAETWTPGSLTNSFDVDPGTAGNDVTATVSGDTAQLRASLTGGGQQTPAITSNLLGGFAAGHMSLQLAVDLANNTQGVTVTIDFSNLYANGVSNVSFQLFDLDFSNSAGNTYQDILRNIYATSTTGTQIAPTITPSANNSVSGTGINQVITGNVSTSDTLGTANATISFSTTDIRSITFTYGSSNLFANPTYQHIALDNISFVPEARTWYVGLFAYAVVAVSTALRWRKQHRRKKLPQV
jgi:hypothetical protein